MSRILAYLRVSSEDQAQSGLGIEAQLEAIRAKVGEPDVIIRDEGFSGGTLERPGLAELLNVIGKGDTLVVAKLDRLSRGNAYAMAWLEKEIVTKAKARLVSAAGEGTEDDSPQGIFMREIMKAFASFELAVIKQRTSAAVKVKMERKRQAREKTGGKVTFGFDVIEANGVKALIENEKEQEAIRIMVSMRNAGATLQAIADSLHADGILPREGRRWTPTVIRSIIKRSAVVNNTGDDAKVTSVVNAA